MGKIDDIQRKEAEFKKKELELLGKFEEILLRVEKKVDKLTEELT